MEKVQNTGFWTLSRNIEKQILINGKGSEYWVSDFVQKYRKTSIMISGKGSEYWVSDFVQKYRKTSILISGKGSEYWVSDFVQKYRKPSILSVIYRCQNCIESKKKKKLF
jgi:hypothetical protein